MNSHELAKLLLSTPAAEINASVDMSTCDEDSGDRVFGLDLYDTVPSFSRFDGELITLCFGSHDKNFTYTKG